MRPPRFWSNPPDRPGWQALALSPVAMAWQIGAALRGFGRSPYRAPVPVICVGNLIAGGAGKTPMVSALMRRFAVHVPHVVSRGHGGRIRGPHRVEAARDDHAEVGDEPLLLARRGPVWVARERAAGVRAAAEQKAGLVLLDDGYQNPSVVKDASIVMVDAGQGFGNGRVIPAGPLRESVPDGLARASLVVLVGREDARERLLSTWPILREMPIAVAWIAGDRAALPAGPLLAFAGIGRPAKFYETLSQMGAEIAGTRDYADHHPYRVAEIEALARQADRLGASLITTEKDALRLPPQWRGKIATLPIRLEPRDWAPIDALLQQLAL